MELYSWQKDCINAWRENHFHGIVNVVTGAGKTVMALYAVKTLEAQIKAPLRIRIVVPTFPLAVQWASVIREQTVNDEEPLQQPGFYHSGQKDDPNRKYTIYIINSARYCLARHLLSDIQKGFCVLLIADECHHYASPENRKIFDFLSTGANLDNSYFSLGLSATPQVPGFDSILVPALGKEIYRYSFSAAVREKNVCNFSIYQIALSFTPKEMEKYDELNRKLFSVQRRLIKTYSFLKFLNRPEFFAEVRRIVADEGQDSIAETFLNLSYQRKMVNCMASSRISCVSELIRLLSSRERILIFGERIQQANQVYALLSAQFPNQVGRYHSEMTPEAKRCALTRFHDGGLRILVSCRALDEGVDVPDATTGIVLSGSSVTRQRIQRLGRLLRRGDGKHSACLYYLYIRESSEENAFLSDLKEELTICNLSYSAKEASFIHPVYEAAAAHVLERLEKKGTSKKLIKEVRRCFQSGLVRPDWLMSEENYIEKILLAENQREKNYWICMKQLNKEYRNNAVSPAFK